MWLTLLLKVYRRDNLKRQRCDWRKVLTSNADDYLKKTGVLSLTGFFVIAKGILLCELRYESLPRHYRFCSSVTVKVSDTEFTQ